MFSQFPFRFCQGVGFQAQLVDYNTCIPILVEFLLLFYSLTYIPDNNFCSFFILV